MNNIDYLVNQQSRYSQTQLKFFKDKTNSIKCEDSQSAGILSPGRSTKYILQLNQQNPSVVMKYIRNQPMIEILELIDCRLKTIPVEVLLMQHLRILKLDNNYIKVVPTLEVEIFSIKNNLLNTITVGNATRHLDVSMNKLKSFTINNGIMELNLLSNEFIILPKLPTTLKTLHLDWFRYTQPQMNQCQTQPTIRILTQMDFNCLEFLKQFSSKPLVNLIYQAAIKQDIGAMISMATVMDINHIIDGETALSLALKHDSLFSVRHLLEIGANIDIGSFTEGSILGYILSNQLPSLCSLIVSKLTPNSFALDNKGNSPLHYLSCVDFDETSAKVLVKARSYNIEWNLNKNGQSPIHLAIIKFKNQLLNYMLMLASSIEYDDLYNVACQSENYSAVIILFNRKLPFYGTIKHLAQKSAKTYKLLQSIEQFDLKYITSYDTQIREQLDYEVKLLSKTICSPRTQNYIQQLRQYVLYQGMLSQQQNMYYIKQMLLKIKEIQKQLSHQEQLDLLCEIKLTTYFQTDSLISKQLTKLNQQLVQIIGVEYLSQFVQIDQIRNTNNHILSYEYFQSQP